MKPFAITLLLSNDELANMYHIVDSGRGALSYGERNVTESWKKIWEKEYRGSDKWCVIFDSSDIEILYKVMVGGYVVGSRRGMAVRIRTMIEKGYDPDSDGNEVQF